MAQLAIDETTDSLSYWHATAEPLVPSEDLPATADAVIIGGGLLGCWTAYWLARAGIACVLLERTAIGWGATGRNGGFLGAGTSMGYANLVATMGRETARRLHRLTLDGRELAHAVVVEEGIACDLRRTGRLSLALDDESFASMDRGRALLDEDGFGGDLLDRQGVQELIATPLGERIVGGLFERSESILHSSRYLTGVARAAERRGARLVRATVEAIMPHGEGTRIATSSGTIDANRVVIALNAWSDTLLPALAGLIVPVRGQILAYEPVKPVFTTAVGVDVTPTGEYWQQTADGSIVIGGCRADAPGADMGVREMVPTPEITARIEQVLPALFPELDGLRVARRWAGLMAFTSDYLPIVDAVPGLSQAWLVGGFCGHGMPFGPRLGQLLAETVVTGALPEDVAPLRLDRESLTRLAVPVS